METLVRSPGKRRYRCPGLLAGGAVASAAGETLIETALFIYNEGVLRGGKLLCVLYPEVRVLVGALAACVTCHRRSDIGSARNIRFY